MVIGQGNPAQANHFRETQKVNDLPILVDPKRKTYKLAGTKVATFNELLGPAVVAQRASGRARRRR